MERMSGLLKIEEYLKLTIDERAKLYLSKEFPDEKDPRISKLKYPCHFPQLAVRLNCPFLEGGSACTNFIEGWLPCEEVKLKKKLELDLANREFERRKKKLLQEQEETRAGRSSQR